MQRKVSKLATASIKPNRHMQLQVGKKGRPKKAGERNGMGDRGKRRRGKGGRLIWQGKQREEGWVDK